MFSSIFQPTQYSQKTTDISYLVLYFNQLSIPKIPK